ncbi:unnamed protein product [Nesidiocoris tenuis]|uniref:W2 domain-containing protein n=1 Tax=Nesidiocoris tenuis TaxID=355587 RepID=A0A6H5GP91_9HEMI|nr:unnamed protein product [Nesidiocoris tenuis]
MSQKTEKPVLSGQRIKTRKRDEKEKYDPSGFRDSILAGLDKAGNDLDAVSKYLDGAGSKLDYRRYGEALFDILIAGGLLVPGGSIAQDGDKQCRTNSCIFSAPSDMASLRNYEQVFTKLMRRYKYLEKMFEDEMKKVLVFLKGFTEEERIKLARMTALWIANSSIPPSVLHVLNNVNNYFDRIFYQFSEFSKSEFQCFSLDHLVKDALALDFILEVFVTWKQEKGLGNLTSGLKRSGLEGRMLDFFPPNKRTEDHLKAVFEEKGLSELTKLHLNQQFPFLQASQHAKRFMQKDLLEKLSDGMPMKEIVTDIRDAAAKNLISEQDIITLIWVSVMSLAEWNKKEELVADQALKHLQKYVPLFVAFTDTTKSEMALLLKIQEYCYENMNFMKIFQKIILLFYKKEVLSEEVILKWYRDGHSVKGKMMFLEQMKKFIEWLQNAEEADFGIWRRITVERSESTRMFWQQSGGAAPATGYGQPSLFLASNLLYFRTIICEKSLQKIYKIRSNRFLPLDRIRAVWTAAVDEGRIVRTARVRKVSVRERGARQSTRTFDRALEVTWTRPAAREIVSGIEPVTTFEKENQVRHVRTPRTADRTFRGVPWEISEAIPPKYPSVGQQKVPTGTTWHPPSVPHHSILVNRTPGSLQKGSGPRLSPVLSAGCQLFFSLSSSHSNGLHVKFSSRSSAAFECADVGTVRTKHPIKVSDIMAVSAFRRKFNSKPASTKIIENTSTSSVKNYAEKAVAPVRVLRSMFGNSTFTI